MNKSVQPSSSSADLGNSPVERGDLQRSAARCFANLSAHPKAREWAKRSGSLREAFLTAEDLAVRTYLAVALGVEAPS